MTQTPQLLPPAAANEGPARQKTHTRIIRVSAYSVATVLALLLVNSALPPLLADQSDRAVIDAPITLLTAPISGEVTTIVGRVGQRLEPNSLVAHIENARVDRSTLITLEGKVDELQASLQAAQQKKASDEAYVAALDLEIRQQVAQTTTRLESQIAEARARVSASEASGIEKKAIVDRQQSLVSRDVVSLSLLRPAEQQYAAAQFGKEAEAAKMNQKVAQLDAVRKGIFAGDDLTSLSVLSQKRRDLAFDAQRLGIEASQLAASLASQQALMQAEKKRLDNLADAELRSKDGGLILNVGAAPGRHVSPGDSVATLVDCDRAFVVAIFSYRQAQELSVGTTVRIYKPDSSEAQFGTVSEILPKTNDKNDQQYAVPFPQTERREMYVLVSMNNAQLSSVPKNSQARVRNANPCSVGQWVTVARQNSWIPSASIAWNAVTHTLTKGVTTVADKVASAVASILPGSASAQQRPGRANLRHRA
jgi:hypothetical protein